jgi:membrane-associated phospholipid phosphatase
MVTYVTVFYFFLLPAEIEYNDKTTVYKIIGLVFICTFLFPVFAGLAMKRYGHIESIHMENQRERNWPLLQTAILYVGAYYALNHKAIPHFLPIFMLGSIVGILVCLIINLKWKISLHMIGAGGLCGGILAILKIEEINNPILFSICILFAGILGTARLFLKSHSPAQILVGFVIGFAIEFLLLFYAFPR